MIYQGGKRTKIVAAQTADEFESKLNTELEALDKKRSKYELQFNHTLGFCAYIIVDQMTEIPETVAEEFQLAGERHVCQDCPFWEKPTRGNVKYTRCPITAGIRRADSPCCDEFYERLLKGEIELKTNREEVDG